MIWWTRPTHPFLWVRPASGSGAAAGTCRIAGPATRTLPAGFETRDALREWAANLHARVDYQFGRDGRMVSQLRLAVRLRESTRSRYDSSWDGPRNRSTQVFG